MVMKAPPQFTSNRNLLGYFVESKFYKRYEEKVLNNVAYWELEDKARACAMLAAQMYSTKRGYRLCDWIWDVYEYIRASHLKPATRKRLLDELDQLEMYHRKNGTWDDEI